MYFGILVSGYDFLWTYLVDKLYLYWKQENTDTTLAPVETYSVTLKDLAQQHDPGCPSMRQDDGS